MSARTVQRLSQVAPRRGSSWPCPSRPAAAAPPHKAPWSLREGRTDAIPTGAAGMALHKRLGKQAQGCKTSYSSLKQLLLQEHNQHDKDSAISWELLDLLQAQYDIQAASQARQQQGGGEGRSPAVKKMRVPVSAGCLEPDTGASRNRAPVRWTSSAICADAVVDTVDASMYPLPVTCRTKRSFSTTSAAVHGLCRYAAAWVQGTMHAGMGTSTCTL